MTSLWLILGACAHHWTPGAPTASPSNDPHLKAELVTDGPLPERLATGDDASLIVYYGGEERGSLDTCGCPHRPRGGIARQAAYVEASRAANPGVPSVFVDGGYWLEDAMGLDGQPRPDVPIIDHWMVEGLKLLGHDALNLGYNDMAGLTAIGDGQPARTGLPVVSANVVGPGVERFAIIDTDGLKVGITGITAPGVSFIPTPGFQVSDPVRAGRSVLAELDPQVDVVVLLAFEAEQAARKLAETGLVDVVVDTDLHREFSAPFREGDAVWVKSHFQTMRIGELRLGLAPRQDGTGDRVVWAVDRKIDLDAQIPSRRPEQQVIRQARAEIDAVQRKLYGR